MSKSRPCDYCKNDIPRSAGKCPHCGRPGLFPNVQFEENSVLFMEHHKIQMSDADKLPKGYRATWGERAKLCVAKLYKRIDATTQPGEYSALLLRQGATSEKDEFIEAHIYGLMTARTIEQVIISPQKKRRPSVRILKAIKEKLAKVGVTIS